jgi:alpha-tubulin suppressor-like RCC1 family protein
LSDVVIVSVTAGYSHSCGLTFKGKIYTWGNTLYTPGTKELEAVIERLPISPVRMFTGQESWNPQE